MWGILYYYLCSKDNSPKVNADRSFVSILRRIPLTNRNAIIIDPTPTDHGIRFVLRTRRKRQPRASQETGGLAPFVHQKDPTESSLFGMSFGSGGSCLVSSNSFNPRSFPLLVQPHGSILPLSPQEDRERPPSPRFVGGLGVTNESPVDVAAK